MNTNETQNTEKFQKMLRGEQVAQPEKTLSAADKKALSVAYFDLFFGLTGLNWAGGDTLGAAWNRARGQIKSMLELKNKNNPAVMYLNQIRAAHDTRWAKEEMTSPHAGEKLTLTGDGLARWKQAHQKLVGDGMRGINANIGKWATPEKPSPDRGDAGKNAFAKGIGKMQAQVMMLVMAQQKQRQRAL